MAAFTGPTPAGGADGESEPPEIIAPEDRKAVMSTLDPAETKWALIGLIAATLAGIALPVYYLVANPLTKQDGKYVAVSPDAGLLGGVILILCVIGFAALWRRKRTLVAFSLFLLGFAFAVFIGIAGFLFIFLGGWIMLRAWRINKYGTTNSKVIRRVAATQPRGKQRKEAARSSSKTTSTQGARKPPTASKRYTPKAAPRKKIPKTSE
jgi:hypothetical protein